MDKVMENAIEKVIYVPGTAYMVHVTLADSNDDDELQTAVLGLLRLKVPQEKIREYLGIPNELLDAVVRVLQFDGKVDEQMVPVNTDTRACRTESATGWFFWCDYYDCFLPLVLIDKGADGRCVRLTDEQKEARALKRLGNLPRKPDEIKRELHTAVLRNTFAVYAADERGNITLRRDIMLRSVCYAHESRAFPLCARVEIRLRYTQDPVILLYAPKIRPDDYVGKEADTDVTYDTHEWRGTEYDHRLNRLLEKHQPDDWKRLQNLAVTSNNEMLISEGAAVLANLGGKDKVLAVARQRAERAFANVEMNNRFYTDELLKAAVEAEFAFYLCQNAYGTEASCRRAYELVLSILLRCVSDEVVEFYKKDDVRRAWSKAAQSAKTNPKYVSGRLTELGLRDAYAEWRVEPWLTDGKAERFADAGNRQQLGYAATMWLLPPVLELDTEYWHRHVGWVRRAIKTMPNLVAVLSNCIKERVRDKATYDSDDASPVEYVRDNIYDIWRAIGRV